MESAKNPASDDSVARQSHLVMIQAVINRLSNNSFLLKGWSVVLVSGLFALGGKEGKPLFVYIAYFPCIVFWGLDGYFLWQERLFRGLYDEVRAKGSGEVTFSMDTSGVRKAGSAGSWSDAVLSRTLLAFHGVVLVTIIVVMAVLLLR